MIISDVFCFSLACSVPQSNNFMCNIFGYMYIFVLWQENNYFYGLLAKTFQNECMSAQAFTEGKLKQCFTVIGHGCALVSHYYYFFK